MTALLSLRQVRFAFPGWPATVDRADLDVEQGAFQSLVGRSVRIVGRHAIFIEGPGCGNFFRLLLREKDFAPCDRACGHVQDDGRRLARGRRKSEGIISQPPLAATCGRHRRPGIRGGEANHSLAKTVHGIKSRSAEVVGVAHAHHSQTSFFSFGNGELHRRHCRHLAHAVPGIEQG